MTSEQIQLAITIQTLQKYHKHIQLERAAEPRLEYDVHGEVHDTFRHTRKFMLKRHNEEAGAEIWYYPDSPLNRDPHLPLTWRQRVMDLRYCTGWTLIRFARLLRVTPKLVKWVEYSNEREQEGRCKYHPSIPVIRKIRLLEQLLAPELEEYRNDPIKYDRLRSFPSIIRTYFQPLNGFVQRRSGAGFKPTQFPPIDLTEPKYRDVLAALGGMEAWRDPVPPPFELLTPKQKQAHIQWERIKRAWALQRARRKLRAMDKARIGMLQEPSSSNPRVVEEEWG